MEDVGDVTIPHTSSSKGPLLRAMGIHLINGRVSPKIDPKFSVIYVKNLDTLLLNALNEKTSKWKLT